MRLLASPSVGLAILVGLAAPARAAPITFIATSDTQWSETDSANDAKRTILATMNTIAGDTFPLAVGGATIGTPRGVLLAGDLTNGGSTKAVTAQWAHVDAALEQRADLIPNLVDTVKGFAKHETEAFQNLADARAALIGGRTPQEKIQANDR
ncbi:MAG: LemA family protein, partial [Thermoguttaceae bacterium]